MGAQARRQISAVIGAGATALVLGLTGCTSSGDSGSSGGTRNRPTSPGTTSGGGAGHGASGSSTSSPVTGRPTSVTVAVSGDELPHAEVIADAKTASGYDFDPMFAQVRKVISAADVSICQLETPLTDTNTNLSTGISINSPASFATALKRAGYDGCSTANNHAFDRGLAGVRATRTIMARNGLKAAGPGSDADHPGQPVFYHAGGLKIAQLAYSFTLNNVGDQTFVPSNAPWFRKNLYSVVGVKGIVADAKAARIAGADLVLVSMHWGVEYRTQPSDEQRTFAAGILNSGAVDYIIGNHPHQVEPCQRINGRMVNYSLGNALSDQGPGITASNGHALTSDTNDGVVAMVTFRRDTAGKITSSEKFQPTYVDRSASHVVKLATKAANSASWHRTNRAITANGNSCGAVGMP